MIYPKDKFGIVIKRGDVLTYPVRWGSSMDMRVCLVTGIAEVEAWRGNVLKVKALIQTSRGYSYDNSKEIYLKKITLEVFERSTIIDAELLKIDNSLLFEKALELKQLKEK